jgi:hypothetical protein
VQSRGVILAALVGFACRAEVSAPPAAPESAPSPTPAECAFVPAFEGEQLVTHPFDGICLVHRTTTQPRPLSIHVVIIDPAAPGIGFRLTGPNGADPRETTLQTTRGFLREQGAQLAINTHFFRPWPTVDEYADLLGLAVSEGVAYSPFDEEYTEALTFDPHDKPAIVTAEEGTADPGGREIRTAVGATERIIEGGKNVARWRQLHPRTAAGIRSDGQLVLALVDGRKDGFSEGMTTPEVADLMISFDVVDAINLDGGGSTTLAVADPVARLVNVPGKDPDTERAVGASLAVFAKPSRSAAAESGLIAYEPFDYGHRDWGRGRKVEARGTGVGGLMRGTGWASAWHDAHRKAPNFGVAAFPEDAAPDTRIAPLSYVDADGARLATAGDQLRTPNENGAGAWRFLDLTQVGADLVDTGGLGKDGSSIWLSFLAQCGEVPAQEGRGGSVSLHGGSVGLSVGRTQTTRWGLWEDESALSDVPCDQASFIVVRVEFSDGPELATLWINPPLTGELGTPSASLSVSDFRFNEVRITSQVPIDFDELRIGTTFASVAPRAP